MGAVTYDPQWVIPLDTGTTMPRWPHLTPLFPDGRVSMSAGDITVALRLHAERLPYTGWHDPPGCEAELELHFVERPGTLADAVEVLSFNDEVFHVRGRWCEGQLRRGYNRAQFTIFTGHQHAAAAYEWGAQEAGLLALACLTWWRGGLLLHAATIRGDDGVYVVTGPSGRGKTTLARRDWDRFLNEEHAFVCPTDDGVWLSHWYSQSRCPREERESTLPVAAIRLLSDQRDRTGLREASSSERMVGLLQAAIWLPGMPLQPLMDRVTTLSTRYPPMWFDHNLESAADVVIGALTRSEPW